MTKPLCELQSYIPSLNSKTDLYFYLQVLDWMQYYLNQAVVSLNMASAAPVFHDVHGDGSGANFKFMTVQPLLLQ